MREPKQFSSDYYKVRYGNSKLVVSSDKYRSALKHASTVLHKQPAVKSEDKQIQALSRQVHKLTRSQSVGKAEQPRVQVHSGTELIRKYSEFVSGGRKPAKVSTQNPNEKLREFLDNLIPESKAEAG